MASGDFLQVAAQELRYLTRSLRRNRAFTLTAVITVALAIGASSAVFSVVYHVLFRPLPYYQDSRLLSVGITAPIERHEFMLGRQYFDWKDHQVSFEQMTSWSGLSDCDLTDQNPVRLTCARVESNFLSTLGVKPFIGRDFQHEDDLPGAAGVALISYALWRSRFGAAPDVAGRSLSLDGKPLQVIGVLPREFELPTLTTSDILVPQQLDEAAQRRSTTGAVLSVFARVKPGVSREQAATQLQPLLNDFLKFVPPQFRKEVKLKIRSVRERQFQDATTASWLLFAAVLALFLTGCVNLANLLLARSASRQRELAVRTALGARRSRLVLAAVSEGLVLAVAGGLIGCALAFLLLRAFAALTPPEVGSLRQVTMDFRILVFATATSALAGLLLGLLPPREQVLPAILAGNRSAERSKTALRQGLVVGQIAASMLLLSMAALLIRSLWNLESEPLGIGTDGVVTAEITLNQKLYSSNELQLAFFEQLESRIRDTPGVTAAAITDSLPPQTPGRSTLFAAIQVEGRPKFVEGTGGTVVWRTVTPDYFLALHIPILQGRDFAEEDRTAHGNVIVLSHALSRRLFPDQDPIGKRIQVNSAPPWFTVIGVAADVRNNGILEEGEPEYYLLRAHAADLGLGNRIPPGALRHAAVVIRTKATLTLAAQWLVAEIHGIDPSVPIDIESMQQRIGALAKGPRFNACVMTLFATISLLLACLGLYGLMSFLVVQRTKEIGIRIAVGADYRNIIQMILGHALRWGVAGSVIGMVVSIGTARFLHAVLFHVSSTDPFAIVTSGAILISVAILSAWIPARRAARVDPLEALRRE